LLRHRRDRFPDVRIPLENLLGEENRGFYSIMETFQNERIVIGGICAGECAKAIALTTNYVKTRQAFGGPLWNQQGVRLKLAMLAAKAAAARALAYHAAGSLRPESLASERSRW